MMKEIMEEIRKLEIAPKHYVITAVAFLITFAVEFFLLRGLSVYNTTIGTYLLITGFLTKGIFIGIISFLLIIIAGYFKRNLVWGLYYLYVVLACMLSFTIQTGNGLAMDVTYVWILNKTGLDTLNLQYLNGLSIIFAFTLVLLLFLIDCRISYEKGKDGKKHFYVRSKLLGLIRIFLKDDETVGENADYPILVRTKKKKQKNSSSEIENACWNDKVRMFSLPYGIWAAIKFSIGFSVASAMANSFSLKYLVIQNYLDKTGMSWFELLQRYMGIFWMRFTGNVNTPASFPINEAVTFEFFQFLQPLLFWFCVIWIVRIIISVIGEFLCISLLEVEINRFISRLVSRIFIIFSLVLLLQIVAIPTLVFDAGTPYGIWQLMIWFGVCICLALAFRYISLDAATEYLFGIITKGSLARRVFKVIMVFIVVLLLFVPSIVSMTTVGPYMQGRRSEYVWEPAYIPTIDFTKWAYETDEIERIDTAVITANETETLSKIRIFNLDTAKINMKAYVGGTNWMSIDPSDVDIICPNETEYWISLVTLVTPPYQEDTDLWRTQHMLLTHSEKILAQESASTKIVDIKQIFGLEETPQIYYGEGGLWKEVDEVYLDIKGFQETHIPEYQGPSAYNDKPDYVYKGFWKALKFYGMWRWDFAQGDYGDISVLTTRDTGERISKILLPGMDKESDAYPVADNDGNVYLLYWILVSRESPSEFCDYPEHSQNQISRKFAIALVNLKNGEIDGYLMNQEKDDYVLSLYRPFYSQWDKPVPDWLKRQLRYPEEFFEKQIDVYNWYFQDDFQKWQRNEFYEPTLDNSGNVMEDVRYIMMPINGNLTWSAVRLVEWYKGTTRNLAGMYIAPCGEETEKVYFVDFGGKTVIGPSVALSVVRSNAELTKHPNFNQWSSGNILMYSLGGEFYYSIPYYKQEAGTILPQMVAVVNAQDQSMGFHIIQNPRDSTEVSTGMTYAFQRIGVNVGTINLEKNKVNGTLVDKEDYVENGNTRWLLNIHTTEGTIIEVQAKVELLEVEVISEIINLKVGDVISVRLDQNGFVVEILS